ncbi:adenylate/guanylate cyclase domain-containing protein [Massilia sp. W12]|uniref:CHASE2 domain-containing protein n=1 Tax=Massilia sp. W12 TaxID=3126507 RepID=UPI0030D543A0
MPNDNRSWFANEWLRDQFVQWLAQDTPEQRFVVIDIDEKSLASIGPWPWPRARLADLIEELLGNQQAKGVALDMLLPDPLDAPGDARLAMLGRFGPLLLAQAFDYQGNLPLTIGQLIAPPPARTLAPPRASVPASGFLANHAALAHPDAKAGNIGLAPDKDGMIRRLPLYTRYQDKDWPTLTLALVECCSGRATRLPRAAANGFWRVPYQRQWSAYTVIPASVILRQELPPGQLEHKLVLVGSSALGLGDRVATPLAANSSGVLVHASALTRLLDLQEGVAPAPWPGRALALAYTFLLCLLWLWPRQGALSKLLWLLGAGLLWLPLAAWCSVHDGEFSASAPLLSLLVLLVIGMPLDWQTSQRMSRRLLNALRQYVAPAVVDELLKRGLQETLAPAQRQITTLIADMQGYTSQVEQLDVHEAAQLTSDFLACLTGPVLAARGTIDKYTGDGIVAFWGAPLPSADHADCALDAARGILQRVAEFSRQREAAGLPGLRVRIGIESGEAMAGDYGSAERSIYTAVGDSVNVAARLEQLARDYPHDVIIGQGCAASQTRHQLQALGEVHLRGREKPIAIHTLQEAA